MENIFAAIQSIYPVSDTFLNALKHVLKHEKVKKGQWLLRPDEVSNRLYFVESGLLRGFYIQDGKDNTVWFMKENDFVVSIESFYSRIPSQEYIEASEDSVLRSITYDQLQMLYRNFIEFNYVGRVLTERYYVLSEQRNYKLRTQSTQERYQELLLEIPDLLNRVPVKHIASFLSLTPETLSRIRARRL